MKVVAHPVVVAAALGLLGPEALAGFSEQDEADPTCVGCGRVDEGIPAPEPVEPELGLLGTIDETLFTVEAPSPEDVARLELEWKQLTSGR